ncbi:hypothetical protein [Polyangium mundeleinium]|uniref:Uncharacterized protein n=1 Tax=Polyangium mundeleinium TaxID=2995306 RepID=A0ABT5EX10_9BACT|nr:hypothetical protein [Polyangium mundeleinium]MDC0746359.1 hypothetical protein [Polyangium mundeleinium]
MPIQSSDDPIHTLDILAAKVGAPQAGLLDALLAGTDNEQLTDKGREIATSRLVVDGVRLYQEAYNFWQGATDPQKKCLKGFSLPLLGVAVHQLLALHVRAQKMADDTTDEGKSRAKRATEASRTASHAVAVRDQAASALRDAAGLDPALRAEVDETVGTADTPDTLARGLDGLANVLDAWLKAPPASPILARLTLASLDAAYAEELRAAANAVRTTAANAGERQAAKAAAQAGLDREDGVAILLLGQIVRAFEAAHDLDPTIPRLLPNSTRRLFSRRTKKKETGAAEA